MLSIYSELLKPRIYRLSGAGFRKAGIKTGTFLNSCNDFIKSSQSRVRYAKIRYANALNLTYLQKHIKFQYSCGPVNTILSTLSFLTTGQIEVNSEMKPANCIGCNELPCYDISKNGYLVPAVDLDPGKVKAIMISEAPPENPKNYFYAPGAPFYLQTTIHAFHDAGMPVNSMQEILDLGFYLTTAIKCPKTQYGVSAATIKNCSAILEKELALFPNIEVYVLMGDVAIKAFNYLSKSQTGKNTIPAGSTYKIRKNQFYYQDRRVFPSYVQTGQNYLIEKSKREMIAEDLAEAIKIIR